MHTKQIVRLLQSILSVYDVLFPECKESDAEHISDLKHRLQISQAIESESQERVQQSLARIAILEGAILVIDNLLVITIDFLARQSTRCDGGSQI
jgi:hypothetical protein